MSKIFNLTIQFMAIKKTHFILGFLFLASFAQAQTSAKGGTDWKDSSLIPPSRMAQHNEFLNNQYIFPAKPRNQWELGIKVGSPVINGDVSSVFPAFGYGLHLRKSLGYLLSVRAEYFHGTPTGLNWKPSSNYMFNSAWRDNGYKGHQIITTGPNNAQSLVPAQDVVYYNYKSNINDLGVQFVLSLSNIRFHKSVPKFQLYALAGFGATYYETKVDALNASGGKYNFNAIGGGSFASRKDTKDALRSLLDGKYETAADSYGNLAGKLFGKTAKVSSTIGLGAAFKLSKRVNVALEHRMTFITDDLLDGQRWNASPVGQATLTQDWDFYQFFSAGLNINIF
jgi:hypothetical protein